MDSSPTCTKEEVESLEETKASVTEAAKVVDKALKVAKDNYEKETGVTLSPANLTTAATTTASTQKTSPAPTPGTPQEPEPAPETPG